MFEQWTQYLPPDEEDKTGMAGAFPMHCLRCKGDMEYQGSQNYLTGQRNRGAWYPTAGDAYEVYRCVRCGRLEFYDTRPDQEIAVPTDIKCLECGATITPDLDACPQCGWTWEEDPGDEP